MGRLNKMVVLVLPLLAATTVCVAQVPPDPPLVIGRDPAEPGEIIGKNFLLRVWLSNVGGPGMQQIKTMRVAPDGTIQLPDLARIHAEARAHCRHRSCEHRGVQADHPDGERVDHDRRSHAPSTAATSSSAGTRTAPHPRPYPHPRPHRHCARTSTSTSTSTGTRTSTSTSTSAAA